MWVSSGSSRRNGVLLAVLVALSDEDGSRCKVLSCKCLFNFRLTSRLPSPHFSVNGGLFHSLSFLLFVATIAGRFTELDAMLICLACVVWTNTFDSLTRPENVELFAC